MINKIHFEKLQPTRETISCALKHYSVVDFTFEIQSAVKSDKNSVVSMARICETIPHEIVTGISQSLARVVVDS